MRILRGSAWALLAVTCLASVAQAQRVDPEVSFVASAGHWDSPAGSGTYRVVVWHTGFEHVSSGATAEWIAGPDDTGENARVVSSRPLIVPGFYSLKKPELVPADGKLRVELKGVRTYEPDADISCVFELAPDGTATMLRPCG